MKNSGYFDVKEIRNNTWQIYEPAGVTCTLFVGTKRALLWDTGYGFGNIRALVESLTDLPYVVVNSHGHLDHAGGNFQFSQNADVAVDKVRKKIDLDGLQMERNFAISANCLGEDGRFAPEIWIHPADISVYDIYQREQKPLIIAKYLREQEEKGLPWPEDFNAEDYLTYKECDFRELSDGQVFDLGGQSLRVLFLPGHTWGSVVLWDEQERLLFSGDNISNSLWIQFPQSADLYEFSRALDGLRALPIVEIFGSHQRSPWPPEMISYLQETIARITPKESKVFIHPRTGVESRVFSYRNPAWKIEKKIYVVYDHRRISDFL